MVKKVITKEIHVRNPYPVFFKGTTATLVVQNCEYQNSTNELSEIKEIKIKAPPGCTVEFQVTERGNDVSVFAGIEVGRLPVEDGYHIYKFRQVERDQPFIVRKNQYWRVKITNSYTFTVSYEVLVERNKVIFFTETVEKEVGPSKK